MKRPPDPPELAQLYKQEATLKALRLAVCAQWAQACLLPRDTPERTEAMASTGETLASLTEQLKTCRIQRQALHEALYRRRHG